MSRNLFACFTILAMLCTAAATADVYRWVDDDGNVIFSDTPEPGAEKIEVKEPSIVPSTRLTRPRPTEKRSPKPAGYEAIEIVAPANEETFRNVSSITVSVSVKPALDATAGDQIQFYLDGAPHGEAGPQTSVSISDITRGEHRLEAAVVGAGGETIRSGQVVIFVHQQSQLFTPPAGGRPGSPGT